MTSQRLSAIFIDFCAEFVRLSFPGAMPYIFVDGHVHIHACFRLEVLLASALRHFHTLAQAINATPCAGFLLLTESAGTEVFAGLKADCAAGRAAAVHGFQLEESKEAGTLVARSDSGQALYLVAGRQIVTQERLEVLALGYGASFPDGRPIEEVLSHLAAALPCRPLAVLPWGAGKWLGKRGRKVEQLVTAAAAHSIFLGDNGNRPFFWPLPALFKRAGERGIRNLPGSDPLPFPGQEKEVGGFGFRLAGTIDPEAPFSSLRALLLDPSTGLASYGRCERLYPFFKHQLSMQLHKKSSSIP